MFENLVECTRNRRRSKKWTYFAVTSIIWSLALVGVIIAGIFLYDAQLDKQLFIITMLDPLPPAPPPPPLGTGRVAATNTQQATTIYQPQMTSVREAPPLPAEVPAELPGSNFKASNTGDGFGVPGGSPDGVIGGVIGGSPDGVIGGTYISNPIPPPPPSKPDPETQPVTPTPSRIRQSEGVIRGNAIVRPKPEYPQLARSAHQEGEVQIEITIGEDGSVVDARIMNGPALLRQAALNAARQWRFNPTLLNKTPVKVQGILTFKFTL
jgi:periplasmic protein TonB